MDGWLDGRARLSAGMQLHAGAGAAIHANAPQLCRLPRSVNACGLHACLNVAALCKHACIRASCLHLLHHHQQQETADDNADDDENDGFAAPAVTILHFHGDAAFLILHHAQIADWECA
eukprot:359159-Chlamydomonas_euryale.AAC.10